MSLNQFMDNVFGKKGLTSIKQAKSLAIAVRQLVRVHAIFYSARG